MDVVTYIAQCTSYIFSSVHPFTRVCTDEILWVTTLHVAARFSRDATLMFVYTHAFHSHVDWKIQNCFLVLLSQEHVC